MTCHKQNCTRLVPEYFSRHKTYVCIRHHYESTKAARKRYQQSAKGRAVLKRMNDKRLHIGRRYIGTAKTQDEAQRVQAHIHRRLHELTQRKSRRAESQGDPAC